MKVVAVLVVVLVLGGCGNKAGGGGGSGGGGGGGSAGGNGSAVDPADPRAKTVHRPVPPGPYIVAYNCSHSMEPWGRGGEVRNASGDLAKRTWTTLSYQYSGEPTPTGEAERPPAPTVTAMSPGAANTLRTAIDRMLAGGPYRAEYPPSEGVPCTLTVTTAAGAPVFAIEKAFTEEKDAASAAVQAFLANQGR